MAFFILTLLLTVANIRYTVANRQILILSHSLNIRKAVNKYKENQQHHM